MKKIKYSLKEDNETKDMDIDMIIYKNADTKIMVSDILFNLHLTFSKDKDKKEFIFTCLKKYDNNMELLKSILKNRKWYLFDIEGPIDLWVEGEKSKTLNRRTNVSLYKLIPSASLR